MSTNHAESISAALFGKTRRAALGLLYEDVERTFYLREIARRLRISPGTAQRELRRLSRAGILRESRRGRQAHFQADPQCPVFSELRSLIFKTMGVVGVLRTALGPLSDRTRIALIYGSWARGVPTSRSDIDLFVVGDVGFSEIVAQIASAQDRLARDINPVVYTPSEFVAKTAQAHPFATSVLRGAKLFLIGSERELAGLAEERMAGRATE